MLVRMDGAMPDGDIRERLTLISNDLEAPLTVPAELGHRGMTDRTGQIMSPARIAAAAAVGEPHAGATMALYEDRLARGLATVINLLDPEVIVLGGGLSALSRLYDSVPRLWERHVFSDRVDTALRPPRHGDSSGVRGAAWLWREEG